MKSIWYSAVLVTIVLSACKKNCDEPVLDVNCKLQQILNPDSSVNATIYYSDWGAPLHIERSEPGTGDWEYIFYYDDLKRLVGLNEGVNRENETITQVLWKYFYDGDVIKYDTLYTGENIENGSGYFAAGEYTYDSRKRVIKYVRKDFISPEFIQTFDYTYPDEDPFTNNHSILGGNKELMFVNRDYSKSNTGTLETNSAGYPTKLNPAYKFLSWQIAWVNYNCGTPKIK
ncbi:MAG TPA: hypothetical protein VLC28_14465 [Flavitalea sp.]|nr:hypothetical protein [Flavitalea sp.]